MSQGANVKMAVTGAFSGSRRFSKRYVEKLRIAGLKRSLFLAQYPSPRTYKVKCHYCGKRHVSSKERVGCIRREMKRLGCD